MLKVNLEINNNKKKLLEILIVILFIITRIIGITIFIIEDYKANKSNRNIAFFLKKCDIFVS